LYKRSRITETNIQVQQESDGGRNRILVSMSSESGTSVAHPVYRSTAKGIPNLRVYFGEFWRRRDFAIEISKAGLRAANADSLIGSFWLVLNPLLLAGVYYVLVTLLSGSKISDPMRLPHIVGGIFVYYFFAACMTQGAGAVTSAGKLINNTSFPRLLLIYAVVRTAFFRFIPTIPVFFLIYLSRGQALNWHQLLAIPALIILMGFSFGIATLLAVLQVYFRDTASFLPYVNRVWLYISPVLFYPERISSHLGNLSYINPLYSLIGIWGEVLTRNETAPIQMWIAAAAWSISTLILSCLLFMVKERDFAVRI